MRGVGWHLLLSYEKFVPRIKVFWTTMIRYLGNNLLPARAGDLIRPMVLGHNGNMSQRFVLGTILGERIFDVLVFISILALTLLKNLLSWLPNAVQTTH